MYDKKKFLMSFLPESVEDLKVIHIDLELGLNMVDSDNSNIVLIHLKEAFRVELRYLSNLSVS